MNDVQHPSFLLPHWQLETTTTLLMTEQNPISEQRLHTYPPSSPILPISQNDTDISSVENSTREPPTVHGSKSKKGTPNVANETQRAMHSRHLIMIGMSLNYPMPVAMWAKTFFAQLLVAPLVQEYSWVQESYVDRAHFHIVAWSLTCLLSSPYRQAVLEVQFSHILLSAYSFTLWWLLCKLLFLWLNSVLTNFFDWYLAARCLQCTLWQVLSRLSGLVSFHLRLASLSVSLSFKLSYYLNKLEYELSWMIGWNYWLQWWEKWKWKWTSGSLTFKTLFQRSLSIRKFYNFFFSNFELISRLFAF